MKHRDLRELRAAKGLYPSYVAKKLNISTRHLSRIENGEGYLTKERARVLARLYNVKMSEIMEFCVEEVN